MAEPVLAGGMPVEVVYAPAPREVVALALHLPIGSTVGDAIHASGLLQRCPELQLDGIAVGIWGTATTLGQVVCAGDRVEIYRPLTVDPKTARRERFRQQGARGAGLFARKRPGAKSGY